MEKNEVRKVLYKEKPVAKFDYIRKGLSFYSAESSMGKLRFEIPVSDMGDADFLPEMEAQYLFRWFAD